MRCRFISGPVALGSLALATLLLGAGCDSPGLTRKAKAPVAPPPMAAVGQATTTAAQLPGASTLGSPSVETASLSVSNEIAVACGIATGADGKATSPNFDFDSAALSPEDRALLAQVARCLTEGTLRGRAITLVGHTDPRGEPEYNMTLGGSRADSVNRYMVDLGVGRTQMSTTSRGEMDATGTSEAGWAQDRRVDIELVKK